MSTRNPERGRRNFTADEWQQLIAWSQDVPLHEQAERLGRSYGTIIYARSALLRRGLITRRDGAPVTYRRWTREEDHLLEALLSQGSNYKQIGKRMDRPIDSVATRAYKRGLSKMGDGGTYSACGVARLLGVSCPKTVLLWIQLGWLKAANISDGTVPHWRIELEAVWNFLENEQTWMAWAPERIADADLRSWAVELRGNGPRWISAGEAKKRLHVHQAALCSYARRGLLKAVKYMNWWYDEADLAKFRIPSERERAA